VVVKAARKNDSDGPLADFGSTAMFTHHQYVGCCALHSVPRCVCAVAWVSSGSLLSLGALDTDGRPVVIFVYCCVAAVSYEQEDHYLRR